jgi:hypothetical protein
MQVWINQGDIVLLSLRDFQDDKADVIVKYSADEARNRKYRSHLAFAGVDSRSSSLRRAAGGRQDQRDGYVYR